MDRSVSTVSLVLGFLSPRHANGGQGMRKKENEGERRAEKQENNERLKPDYDSKSTVHRRGTNTPLII